MVELKFDITLDKLVGKERPRFRKFKNMVLTYTPKTTKGVEQDIKDMFISMFGTKYSTMSCPVSIYGKIYHKMPKSWSKKKQEQLDMSPFMSKPDIDNVIKLFCDSLNGVAYEDDKQVWDLGITQQYGKENRISVSIIYGNINEKDIK